MKSPAEIEHFQRVRNLFAKVRALSDDDRAAVLDSECLDDLELRAEIELLLAEVEGSPLPNPTGEGSLLQSAIAGFAEEQAPALPDQLGPYRIRGVLGEGGMAVVYDAEELGLNRRVALKVLRHGVLSEVARKRFIREAELLAKMSHPGIAKVLRAGTEEVRRGVILPWIALERVAGRDPTTYAEELELSLTERIRLVAQLADTVAHAHDNHIVHRDLKPANVLVDDEGRVRVLDFGVAHLVDADLHSSLLTRAGDVIGTLAYMSPEQAAGLPIDTRADVYALGVMTFELIAGRPPHDVGTMPLSQALQVIVDDQAPALRSIDHSLPQDLDIVVGKALANDPEARYPSASELAADLRRWLRKEPVTARTPGAWYRTRLFVRRHRTLTAVVSAAMAVLLAATIVSVQQRQLAVDEKARAEDVMDSLLTDLYGRLEEVNRLELLEAVAVEALDYYDRSPSATLDDDSARQRGLALLKIGSVLSKQGHPIDAIESLEASIEHLSHVSTTTPSSSTPSTTTPSDKAPSSTTSDTSPSTKAPRRHLAEAHSHLGEARAQLGELDQAVREHRQSIAIYASLATAEPTEPDWRFGMVEQRRVIADILRGQGDLEGAQRELDIALRLISTDEPSATFTAQQYAAVGMVHLDLGELESQAGNKTNAEQKREYAVGLFEKSLELEPRLLAARYSLALSHYVLGFNRLGTDTSAESNVQGLLTHAQRLVGEDGDNPKWLNLLAKGHGLLSDLHTQQQRFDRAESAQRESLRIYEQIAQSNSGYLLNQAFARAGLASLLVEYRDDLESALETWRQAVEDLEEAGLKRPDDVTRRWLLCEAHTQIGDAERRLGRLAAAKIALAVAVDHHAQLLAEHSGVAYVRDRAPVTLLADGRLHADLGQLDEARDRFEQVLELVEHRDDDRHLRHSVRSFHAQALLELERLDEARPIVDRLLREDQPLDRWLLECCRRQGLCTPHEGQEILAKL